MSAPLLELVGVEKNFGAVRALRAVSFTLAAGEVHALVGENGAGKSTLIKILAGAHAPDSGEVRIAGHSASRLTPAEARKRGVACVFQQPALFPDLTVAENLGLRLESTAPWRLVNRSARREKAARLLARVGARIDPDEEAGALSMPEQQLVEIAAAVGAGARALILDEPTASLTRPEQERLFEVVRSLRRDGAGVVYISHRLEEIAALADRITVLRDGETVASFPSRGVAPAEVVRLMVGRPVSALYPPATAAPGAVRLEVRNLACRAAGLADVSFSVRSGEIVGLAGLVGAGRTELAETLFGITPADGGEIRLDGALVRIQSPAGALAAGLGCLPEDRRRHGVIGELSVACNLTLGILAKAHRGGWLRPAAEKRNAREWIEKLEIKASGPDAPVSGLSGGNQQKVALAGRLGAKPRVLVLDEPTQGVDVGAKAEIHRLLRQLAAEGLAILLISSDLPEILGMSDRILVMRARRLVVDLPGGVPAHTVLAAALGLSEEGA